MILEAVNRVPEKNKVLEESGPGNVYTISVKLATGKSKNLVNNDTKIIILLKSLFFH